MKYKYGFIGICLFICLFSIASISAADVNGTAIQTDNNIDNTVALDNNVPGSNIGTGLDDVTSNDDKDYILSSSSFSDIQKMIDDAVEGSEINLTTDYSLANGGDTIKISKSITIHGNGHTLDGHHLKRIVSIEANSKNIVFDNIKFVNGGSKQSSSGDLFEGILTAKDVAYNDDYGGAIYYMYNEENDKKGSTFNDDIGEDGAAIDGPMTESSSLTITNCEFRSNGVKYCGGAIYIGAGDQLSDFGWPVDGDALLSVGQYGNLSVNNCKFYDNVAQSRNGGAIFSEHNYILINNTEFKDNHVDHRENIFAEAFGMNSYYYAAGSAVTKVYRPLSGGAIYSRQSCNIYNSKFEGNKVGNGGLITQVGTSGGAIHCRGELNVSNTIFNSNAVNDYGGGAIFAEKYTNIYNSTFENNTAVKGGAIYSFKLLNVYNSTFNKNRHIIGTAFTEDLNLPPTVKDAVGAYLKPIKDVGLDFSLFVSSEGGAICTRHSCNIESCHFEENYACEKGGAIYCEGMLNITGTDNYFIRNEAYRDGQSLTELFASSIKNLIHNQDGGAIYCKNNMEVYNATFIRNSAVIDGGAIYCEKTSSFYNTKFEENFLKGIIARGSYGGAICTEKLDIADNCSFKKNNADTSSNMGLFSKGGAVYIGESCNPEFISCNFNDNNVHNDGGAIYVDSKETHLKLSNCYFNSNKGGLDGGAVFCTGMTSVSNSIFTNNQATGDILLLRSYGGAIRSKKFINITNSTFNNNFANNWGGAVYADGGIGMTDSIFIGNTAKNAGAVYTSVIYDPISNSVFKNNKAKNGDGGAVYVYNRCNPKFTSCIFEQNSATSDGGAIYLDSSNTYMTLTDSTFKSNTAGKRGGAIFTPSGIYNSDLEMLRCHFTENSAKQGGAVYASTVVKITESDFTRNKANGGDGGAIYINNKCEPKFYSCTFEKNYAQKKGGAIYLDSLYFKLTLSGCSFNANKAESYGGAVFADGSAVLNYGTIIEKSKFTSNQGSKGGAVYANKFLKPVTETAFLKNRATGGSGSHDGDGGAVYINNNCKPEFKSCRFEENTGYNRGGAIYLDSILAHLKVSDSTFINNHAEKKKDTKKTYLPGHSVYNRGYYDSITNCWFGTTSPNFNDQFVEYKVVGTDKVFKPSNYLKSPIAFNQPSLLSCADDEYSNSAQEIVVNDDLLGASDNMLMAGEEDFDILFFNHVNSKHSNVISYFSSKVAGKLILSVNGNQRFTKDIADPDEYLSVFLYDLKITADGMYNISAEYIVANTSEKINIGSGIVDVSGVDWDSDEYVTVYTYVDTLNNENFFIEIENNGKYVNGVVSVYVDGDLKLEKNFSPADEQMFFEVTVDDVGLYNNISLGNHTVKVNYMKDGKEKHEVEKTVQFYAEPNYVQDFIISETEKDVMEIKYIKGFEGNATLYHASIEESNQSGHPEWIKGDVYKSANFTDGIAVIYLEGLSAGEKYFILNITDYDLEKKIYVTVKKNSPEISASISPSETTFGNNFTLKFSGAKTDDKLYVIVDDLDFVDLPLTNGTLDDIIWGLDVGDHRIKLVYDNGVGFNGTDFYSNTFFVTVKKAPTPAKIKLTLKSIPVYKYAEKALLQATLKINGKAVKSKTIKFKFNGKTYKAKTNSKGIAKVTIKKSVLKKLKVGKKITYQASYGKKTVKKTVKVKKEAPKTTLTLKKANVKKSAKNALLQAILKKGKSALKSKTVKFKFNGKTYKAKTNSKGIAKVTIKKSVLKKLKVGKKITYQASYGKITVKKTVKVIK